MKAATFYAPGDIRLEEIPEPDVVVGGVKIRVRACSMCGTDVKISRSGHPRMSAPQVIGHEIAGEIVAVGEGVPTRTAEAGEGWAVGDRVQVIAAIPDGTCIECRAGHEAICAHQLSMGYQFPGGFAEYLVVPPNVLAVDGLHRIPEGVSFAEASVAEPLACVLNGQELARVGDGDTVVVLGAGPIGCLHVRLARARGAARILLLDPNAERLARAAELVAPDLASADADPTAVVLAATDGRGADVVIVAAASGSAQEQAVGMLAPRGRLSLFGGLPREASAITIDANLVHYRELTLVGVNGSTPDQNRRALDLIASGEVPVADLITHRLPLDAVLDGLDLVARGAAIKVTIEP